MCLHFRTWTRPHKPKARNKIVKYSYVSPKRYPSWSHVPRPFSSRLYISLFQTHTHTHHYRILGVNCWPSLVLVCVCVGNHSNRGPLHRKLHQTADVPPMGMIQVASASPAQSKGGAVTFRDTHRTDPVDVAYTLWQLIFKRPYVVNLIRRNRYRNHGRSPIAVRPRFEVVFYGVVRGCWRLPTQECSHTPTYTHECTHKHYYILSFLYSERK